MTRIGVAVCTYRRPEGLARLLTALPAGAPEAATVIVVDNDGGDPRISAAVAAARAAAATSGFSRSRDPASRRPATGRSPRRRRPDSGCWR